MANPTYSQQGWIARLVSNARKSGSDGVLSDPTGQRTGIYQEPFVIPMGAGLDPFVDEGSYFQIAGTVGTGFALTGATQTTWVATTPTIILQNNDATRSIHMDYVRFGVTAAGTALTSLFAATMLDFIPRYSSGATVIVNATGATGGAITAPRSSQSAPTSVALYGGAITAVAAGSLVRTLAPGIGLASAIPVVGQNYTIKFGAADTPPGSLAAGHSPVIVDPGASLLVYLWGAAMTGAPSATIEVCGYLR